MKTCQYCGRKCKAKGLHRHEFACKSNSKKDQIVKLKGPIKPIEQTWVNLRSDTLSFLVEQAINWRGSLVGNPNPLPLMEYDRYLYEARSVLNLAMQ